MKTPSITTAVAGLATCLLLSHATAEEKLVRGKDRVDAPAVGTGVCVHTLFQSGMVLQRDRPIRVWG